MLTKRQVVILKAIVETFINTAEPVGSKTLMDQFDLPYSSATIRNEMAVLEQAGYIEKTHTSSGRIPSAVGYRYYVYNLMDKQLEHEDKFQLEAVFNNRSRELNEVIQETCEVLSELTKLTSVVLGPSSAYERIQRISMIPIGEHQATAIIVTDKGHVENRTFRMSDEIEVADLQSCVDILNELLIGTPIDQVLNKLEYEVKPVLERRIAQYEVFFKAFIQAFKRFVSDHVYFSGATNMMYQPEFADIEKLKKLVEAMNDEDFFKQLSLNQNKLSIQIGKENLISMDDVTVVSSTYYLNDNEKGTIAIIGPTRMNYDKVIGLVEYVSQCIEEKYRIK